MFLYSCHAESAAIHPDKCGTYIFLSKIIQMLNKKSFEDVKYTHKLVYLRNTF